MLEEHLQTFTKSILAASVRASDEAVLRALSVTCEMITAAEALSREPVPFLKSECQSSM